MRIQVLLENTSYSECACEHGLSLYIETDDNRILFDMGQSNQMFENAQKLKVDLSDIDFSVISHGHYDHIGGLDYFLNHFNKTVYIQASAKAEYFSCRQDCKSIGISSTLYENKWIKWVDGDYEISNKIHLVTNHSEQWSRPEMNQHLFKMQDHLKVADDFNHEHSLVVEEEKNLILITGCSHNGLLNIIESVYMKYGRYPSHVIGGFHLSSDKSNMIDSHINEVANRLKTLKIKCYTGHCTGHLGYESLKEVLMNQIEALYVGKTILI